MLFVPQSHQNTSLIQKERKTNIQFFLWRFWKQRKKVVNRCSFTNKMLKALSFKTTLLYSWIWHVLPPRFAQRQSLEWHKHNLFHCKPKAQSCHDLCPCLELGNSSHLCVRLEVCHYRWGLQVYSTLLALFRNYN